MQAKVGQTEGGIGASTRPSGLALSPTSAGLVHGALKGWPPSLRPSSSGSDRAGAEVLLQSGVLLLEESELGPSRLKKKKTKKKKQASSTETHVR